MSGGFRCPRFSSVAEAATADTGAIGDEIDKLLTHRFNRFGDEIQPLLVIDNAGEVVRAL